MPQRPLALETRGGQVTLGVLEIALGVPALHAEGDPVTERVAALLLDPVALRAGHRSHSSLAGVTPLNGRRARRVGR